MNKPRYASSMESAAATKLEGGVSLLGPGGTGKSYAQRKVSTAARELYPADAQPAVVSTDVAVWTRPSPLRTAFERYAYDSRTDISDFAANNMTAAASFMGRLGDPRRGGISEELFRSRMELHAQAETEVIEAVSGGEDYPGSTLVDYGGSFCAVVSDSSPVIARIAQTTYPVIIEASVDHIEKLHAKNARDPKPIYYGPEDLDKQLPRILEKYNVRFIEDLHPDIVSKELFIALTEQRIAQYRAIASAMGERALTVSLDEMRAMEPLQLYARIANHARAA